MGFRVPLTTPEPPPPTSIDTGATPAGAGVRVYQTTVAGFPAGIVEIRDGVAGDAHAGITSVAFLVPQYDEGGALIGYTSAGRETKFTGGSNNGTAAAALRLNVEQAAAGGYEAAAYIDAARIDSSGVFRRTGLSQARIVTPTSAQLINGTPTGASWVEWPNPDYEKLTFSQLADGMIHVSGAVRYTGTAGVTSPDIVAVTGVFVPSRGHEVLSANVNDARMGNVEVLTTGRLRLRGAAPATNGFVLVNGTYHGRDF